MINVNKVFCVLKFMYIDLYINNKSDNDVEILSTISNAVLQVILDC